MKRTLYILICLLTGIAVLSGLAGTGCSLPAFDLISPLVLVGHHDITFVSHTFNGTNSTWTYNVTSGTQPSLSHWVISWCAPDAILDASEDWEYVAPDPLTGITGIKFDAGHEDGETRIVSFTLWGDYPEGPIEVGAYGGGVVNYGVITGPLCEPVATYTITATAGTGGAIAPLGAVVVNEGDSQAFNITPNAGYVISDVLVDGTSVGAVSSYTFTNVADDHTIHAAFSVSQYTITASAGVGGSISPAGAVVVSHGQSQAFGITASTGYAISDVLVDGTSVGAVSSYTFTNVTDDHTIHAAFGVIQYTITASAGVGGSISPVGAVVVSHGQSQAFDITASTGYAIGDVLVDGTSVGAASSYTFGDVTDDHTIHADFEAIPPVRYNLTISSTAGGSATATASPTIVIGPGETKTMSDIPAGMVVSLVATPAVGYRFVNWTGDVGTMADVNATSTTITMNGNYSITANFASIPIVVTGYGLTLVVSPGGVGTAIELTGAGRYEEGDTVAIKAIAADCYVFVNWTATAGVLADPYAAETTFTMPGHAVIVTANFEFIGNPTRALPDHVLPGEKFEVTVTFAAPSDDFHAIVLTDIAPAGWEVRVNVLWADPEATAVNTPAAEKGACVWYGPYDFCAAFTVVYEVRVPVNAEPGAYTFSGSLRYYIEPHPAAPYEQEVTGDIQVQVEEGETVRIAGVTRGVDGAILRGAVVVLYQNGEEIGEVVRDGSGNYEFEFSEFADYEVVVRKAGFRDEAQSVSVATLAIYTVDFVGDHGLIPDAPSISYVLACVSLWKFGEPPLQLSTFTVLDVVSAWMYPRT